MRSLLAISIALFLSTPSLAQTDGGPQRTMTADEVEGAVTIQRGDGNAQPLQRGMVLREGDVIQTGADSRVQISLSDGSTLRLADNAKLALAMSPPAGKLFTARLWFGAVWAKVHKLLQDEQFQVETENAVAGVRGTEFVVEAGEASRDHAVRVYEGSVEVHDHGGQWTHRVEGGRELYFRRGLSPEAPKPFDAASDRQKPLMRWVRERPVRAPEPSERLEHRLHEKERRERPARRDRLLERRGR